MRILVLTRSYPAPGDLYQYPFVHRRVLAYARAGHEVVVFRPGKVANIVIADGHILEPRTNIRNLFINGIMLPLTSRHTRLFDSFKDRK